MKVCTTPPTRFTLASFLFLVCIFDLSQAFHVKPARSVRTFSNVRRWAKPQDTEENVKNPDQGDQAAQKGESPEALQRELNEMMQSTGGGLFADDKGDEPEEMNLYNSVPLFTGAVFSLLSLLGTGYLFYAGITGDDPLMGHPK
jgi:hypothetical protein